MTSTPPPRRRFALTLEDAEPRALAPPERRLARLLKCLLRYYGFKCLNAVETTPTSEVPTDGQQVPPA